MNFLKIRLILLITATAANFKNKKLAHPHVYQNKKAKNQ